MEQADSGGSASATNQGVNSGQPGVEQFVMKIPNNKVNAFIVFFSPFEVNLILKVMFIGCTCHWKGRRNYKEHTKQVSSSCPGM